jgi:hypothetical protein
LDLESFVFLDLSQTYCRFPKQPNLNSIIHPCQRQLEMTIQALSFPLPFLGMNADEAVYGGELLLTTAPSMAENRGKSGREMLINGLSTSLAKIKMFLETQLHWPGLFCRGPSSAMLS